MGGRVVGMGAECVARVWRRQRVAVHPPRTPSSSPPINPPCCGPPAAGLCRTCRVRHHRQPPQQFRPRRDLKDTLLHEMIHAALFLHNARDDDAHGRQFQAHMRRINAATCPDAQRPPGGYNITVFHTMHDEVSVYQTHVWECQRW